MTTKQKTKSETAARSEDMLVLSSELGTTSIQDHVVAKIAGLAVREVEGVHALVPYGTGQAITNLANTIRGEEARDLGVRVEVGTVECAVDLRMVAEYGVSIPSMAKQVRERITARILEMTGLRVKEINIDVMDLWFPEDDEPRVVQQARVQ